METWQVPADGFKWDARSEAGKAVAGALRELAGLDRAEYGYELLCLSVLSGIWYHVAAYLKEKPLKGSSKSHHGGVKKILSYIHEHFQERITVEDLLRTASLSRSEAFRCFKHFVKLFRKKYGIPPLTYRKKLIGIPYSERIPAR